MRSAVYEQGSPPTRHASSTNVAVILALAAFAASFLSILGWLLPVYRLIDWNNDGISIKFNCALAIALCGIALVVRNLSSHLLTVRICGALSGLIGALTLSEHLFSVDLGIDNLLIVERVTTFAAVAPGRMGPPASTMLTLLGVGLILTTFTVSSRRLAGGLGLAVLAVVSLSITGYIFGADQLYSLPHYTGIALQTSLMLAALGVSLVATVPEHGIAAALGRQDTGGAMFRRLLLPIIVVAVVLGWVRVVGQEMGLYDTAFGTAARTIAEMVLLIGLLWWAASSTSHADRRIRIISRMPEENPHPVIRLTPEGGVIYANPAASALAGVLEARPDVGVGKQVRTVVAEALALRKQQSVELKFDDCTYLAVVAPVPEEAYANLYATDITARVAAEGLVAEQANEQAVLYRLTDRVHRADSIGEVFDAALQAVIEGTRCDRGSILLFDEEGVMSFVASRGLSDGYKAAVNGHSPWKQGDHDAVPITIADIRQAEISEELRGTITAEGICALGFFPLNSSTGEVIGKFMVYFDRPHQWSDRELDFAITVARQIAFGIERKMTEEALRSEEERLRLATKTGRVGIWDWDIAGNRVAWTDSLYAMHGISPSEFDGTVEGFAKLVHPHDLDRVQEHLRSALDANVPYDLEFRIVRPDGSTGWFFTNATVVGEGEKRRMVGATVDITERKNAQLASERLAAIVQGSQDAVIGLDLQATITDWNDGAESTFGYTAEEAVGNSVMMLLPEDRWPEENEILTRVRRGENIQHYETVRIRKDGRSLDISLSISPVKDANGEIIGASKIGRDITHRKRAENAIRARETLTRIVEAQEAERSRIARDLHDHLGQQLTALRLKLESIKAATRGDERVELSVEEACSQASQMDRDMSLLAWEMRPVSLESHGLHEVLASFVRDWSQSHGIHAEFQCISRNGRLSSDVETNLYRIAQEALNNILKHAQATEVSITLNQTNGDALLVIEDNGRGFDPSGAESSPRGGLGLVGMRERATILGGRIEIESTPGAGTAIYARVPLSERPSQNSAAGG